MSGPSINQFGDLVRAAFGSYDPGAVTAQDVFENNSFQLGQITAIHTIDDPQNNQKHGTFTLYDVAVYKPDGNSEIIPRCRALQPLFGGTGVDYCEIVPLNPSTDPDATPYGLRSGTVVVVGYLGSQKQNGAIFGAFPSALSQAVKTRPKAKDGAMIDTEFRGVHFKVDNAGQWSLVFNGPRNKDGSLVGANGPTSVGVDSTGAFAITDKDTGSLKIGGGKVALGNQSAELLDLVDQLLTALQAETHVTAAPGFPSSPPINSATYAQIQQKLQTIKGAL